MMKVVSKTDQYIYYGQIKEERWASGNKTRRLTGEIRVQGRMEKGDLDQRYLEENQLEP